MNLRELMLTVGAILMTLSLWRAPVLRLRERELTQNIYPIHRLVILLSKSSRSHSSPGLDIAGAGVSVVSGATKKDAYWDVSNDSDEVKFTVNQVSGVDTKGTRKGKNGESLSVKDEGNGTYSFKADQWSTVNVDYAVAKASLEVKFDLNECRISARLQQRFFRGR